MDLFSYIILKVKYLYTFLFFYNDEIGSSKMTSLKEYINFYKVAKKRARSHDDYIEFEEFQSEIVMKFLKKKGVRLSGKTVLDIGSGRGGYASRFRKEGAKVIALDIIKDLFQNVKGVNFILGDATQMPLKSEKFDFIFCSSIIEHIRKPEMLVSEIKRVLKKNGICYLSFPPFWSPVGAHQFKPFQYLGEDIATFLARKLYGARSYKYDDASGKLHIRTIRQVKKLLKNEGLKTKSVTTRMLPINFAKIPLLNELLTWHVEFIITK